MITNLILAKSSGNSSRYMQFLDKSDFFSSLQTEEKREVAKNLTEAHFSQGEYSSPDDQPSFTVAKWRIMNFWSQLCLLPSFIRFLCQIYVIRSLCAKETYCRDASDPSTLSGCSDFVKDYEAGEMENCCSGNDGQCSTNFVPFVAASCQFRNGTQSRHLQTSNASIKVHRRI